MRYHRSRSLWPCQAACAESESSRCGLGIDLPFRNLVKQIIGLLFLLQGLAQQALDLAQRELIGLGGERTVSGDLVVFHLLRGGDQPSIANLWLRLGSDQLRSLLDQSLHGLAALGLG